MNSPLSISPPPFARTSDTMPSDPDCGVIRFIGVPRDVQVIISIQGSEHLLSLINPGDGREPYLISRGPAGQLLTTRLHRSEESEDYDD